MEDVTRRSYDRRIYDISLPYLVVCLSATKFLSSNHQDNAQRLRCQQETLRNNNAMSMYVETLGVPEYDLQMTTGSLATKHEIDLKL